MRKCNSMWDLRYFKRAFETFHMRISYIFSDEFVSSSHWSLVETHLNTNGNNSNRIPPKRCPPRTTLDLTGKLDGIWERNSEDVDQHSLKLATIPHRGLSLKAKAHLVTETATKTGMKPSNKLSMKNTSKPVLKTMMQQEGNVLTHLSLSPKALVRKLDKTFVNSGISSAVKASNKIQPAHSTVVNMNNHGGSNDTSHYDRANLSHMARINVVEPARRAMSPPPGRRAMSPPPGRRAMSPPPGRRAMSPPPGRRAMSPPPGRRARSPPPGRRAMSPLPGRVTTAHHTNQRTLSPDRVGYRSESLGSRGHNINTAPQYEASWQTGK